MQKKEKKLICIFFHLNAFIGRLFPLRDVIPSIAMRKIAENAREGDEKTQKKEMSSKSHGI